MDEIGESGCLTVFAHVTGNLAAMIGRVQDNVTENVLDGACPGLTFGVFVGNRLVDITGSDEIEMFSPETGHFGHFSLALLKAVFRPHWRTLRLLLEPIQPEPLGCYEVGEQLERPFLSGGAGANRG